MKKNILVLHAYSSDNTGDGLLVDKALKLITESISSDVSLTLCAMYPKTFEYLKDIYPTIKIVDTGLKTGHVGEFIRTLGRIKKFDAVVAVGGGYLRFGSWNEGIKTALAHGPSLLAASLLAPEKTIYLPQSIGPLNHARRPVRFLLGRVKHVCVRDDRSFAELSLDNVTRMPDMATQNFLRRDSSAVNKIPVLTVRETRGKLADDVQKLSKLMELHGFDSYIQSNTSGNNDTAVTNSLNYRNLLDKKEILEASEPRVVVAVRLHAALMSLAAGHYVIHLSYERKGFGAFDDLNLNKFVFNVFDFDASEVFRLVQRLLTDAEFRKEYDKSIELSSENRESHYRGLLKMLKDTILD